MTVQHNDICFVGLENQPADVRIGITSPGKPDQLLYRFKPKERFWVTDQRVEVLPPGNWELIGIYPGLSEEKAARCVKCLTPGFQVSLYQNYKYGLPQPAGVTCGSALESLPTLLDDLKLYTVNPYGEEQRSYSELSDGVDRFELAEDMERWSDAQSRTFDAFAILKLI